MYLFEILTLIFLFLGGIAALISIGALVHLSESHSPESNLIGFLLSGVFSALLLFSSYMCHKEYYRIYNDVVRDTESAKTVHDNKFINKTERLLWFETFLGTKPPEE